MANVVRRAQIPLVPEWTGKEVKALREARRMSIRELAEHLGISDRMVSKWEAGGERVHPRPINQAALDTSLSLMPPDAQERFLEMTGRSSGASPRPGVIRAVIGVYSLVRHPGDGVLMTLIDSGAFRPPKTGTQVWLPGFFIDVDALTNASFARFVDCTGAPSPASWPREGLPPARSADPVRVSRAEAEAYAAWAGKHLPTVHQWQRATRGDEGMIRPAAPEWRVDQRDGRDRPFRCVVEAEDMFALLAI